MELLGINFLFNEGFFAQKWKHCIHIGQQYFQMIQNKEITLGDKTMRFDYQMIGPKPPQGYTLLIGMHGGGGCESEENEEQFENHLALYEGHLPDGVIWFTPRSCQEAWDMWFKDYLPGFFNIVIKGFVLTGLVNPNKVFMSGYSAGGDGTYNLTPMLADWFAGGAMMAGHPNGVQFYNLRNVSFSIQMGGQDSNYDRNQKAREYIQKMQELGVKYGQFSIKYCNIFQECEHWMDLKDAGIFPQFLLEKRNPYPIFILFKQHERYPKKYFYYIEVDPQRHKQLMIVYKIGNVFNIQSEIMPVNIYVNRYTINYSQQVRIFHNGAMTMCRMPERNPNIVEKTIRERMDPFYVFEDCFTSSPKRDRIPLPFQPQQVIAEQLQVSSSQRF